MQVVVAVWCVPKCVPTYHVSAALIIAHTKRCCSAHRECGELLCYLLKGSFRATQVKFLSAMPSLSEFRVYDSEIMNQTFVFTKRGAMCVCGFHGKPLEVIVWHRASITLSFPFLDTPLKYTLASNNNQFQSWAVSGSLSGSCSTTNHQFCVFVASLVMGSPVSSFKLKLSQRNSVNCEVVVPIADFKTIGLESVLVNRQCQS